VGRHVVAYVPGTRPCWSLLALCCGLPSAAGPRETISPTVKAIKKMTETVGEVQSVQTSSGQRGFGFILRANDGRWISLCYETQDEAERARESVRIAVQNAIAVEIDR